MRSKITDIIQRITTLNLQWVGHVAGMDQNKSKAGRL